MSCITGIPWSYERVQQHGGRRPFISLVDLEWWDRFRVAWARIGTYYFLSNNP